MEFNKEKKFTKIVDGQEVPMTAEEILAAAEFDPETGLPMSEGVSESVEADLVGVSVETSVLHDDQVAAGALRRVLSDEVKSDKTWNRAGGGNPTQQTE
jgi:hypothetical protein